jgi:glycosyltransferase involved in cell wall biosynthesis
VPHVLVPRRAWPDDRFPHWAVAALRAAGAEVSESGRRADVALLPAVAPLPVPRFRAARVIGLLDRPARPGDERFGGGEVVATSAALAAQWDGARVVPPAVPAAPDAVSAGRNRTRALRIVSAGPLHWSAGHEHAIVAAAQLLAAGTEVELRVVGRGPAREALLFTAFDLGIERAVAIVDADERRAEVERADVAVVPAVEDRAWLALLHALACGVPAVASDLPTTREIGGATLVPPRDPAALAAALTKPVRGSDPLTYDVSACGRELLA